MRPELLKGNLDLLLLIILKERPAHGYAVIEELRQRSQEPFDLPEGTVYPALHRRLYDARTNPALWSTPGLGRRRRPVSGVIDGCGALMVGSARS